jgi:cell cycle arrest protein BUB3
MDAVDHYLVVGLANRTNQIYDTRNLMEPLYVRESSLKHMTRIIACIPDGSGYAIGSIEGRVAVDYFDPNEKVQASKFSFKCHREKVDQTEMIYPVNALAFHPIQKKSFASGGGDGIVSIWDGTQKKRLRNLPPFPTSISSLDFNCTGTALAIAVSYTYEQGEKEYALINNSHAPDAIHIKDIAESDVTPRIKTR